MNQQRRPIDYQFEQSTFCYMDQLFRLAYSRAGNTQDAEDIVQETYLKAYRAFDSLRQQQSIKSWLTHILINTIRDHRRKGMRAVTTVDICDIEEESLPEPTQISPEEQMCRNEIDPMLSQALHAIPEIFLTPLILREIQESTYDEIALALDIPVGTVMSRLFRARSLLRNALSPKPSPDHKIDSPISSEENQTEVHPNEL